MARSLPLVVGLILSTPPLQAGELDAAVTWSCSPKEGTLVVRYYPSLADAGTGVKQQGPLVFFSLCEVDEAQSTITDTHTKEFVCQLKKDKLEVTLEPGAPNPNLLGRCGAAVTGLITVKRNGKAVLEEKEFEALDCSERERYIARIVFKDGAERPEILHKSYPEQ